MTAKQKALLMQGIEDEKKKGFKGATQPKMKRRNWRNKRVRMRFLAPMLVALSFVFLSSCTVCKLTGDAYSTGNGKDATVKSCIECTGNLSDLKKMLKIK